ncbi:hypothetical protein QU481_05475 [Crenobacter sp. SG2303]|uniref:Lipoprotein SmpA/OmlA domain-containing protein n=1 Tax=Crenobacter oryzisoli TaxID=3056844 RepID=A0ABT7XKL9_9NEIS|nr:hypothetical protein [Crenobacter sp. SG2303]MDN0074342.1 hypothetical protein [Crenobacter sp. SG2303]
MKKQTSMRTAAFALFIVAATTIAADWAMADTVQVTNSETDKTIASTQKPTEEPNSEGISGTSRPDSKLAKLKIGMKMDEVQEVMGHAPDKTNSYETGKRWIPFYFGSDARRLEALYKDDGCLTFTGGNVWGISGGELIHIEFDPTGKCFKKS